MIITIYRVYSGFRNVEDTATFRQPPSDIIYEEHHVELPDGYSLGESADGNEAIYNAEGEYVPICTTRTGFALVDGKRFVPLHIMRYYTPTTVTEARQKVGMSQQLLANTAGINIRQIQRAESDPNYVANMTARNFISLCDALGTDPHELLAGAKEVGKR